MIKQLALWWWYLSDTILVSLFFFWLVILSANPNSNYVNFFPLTPIENILSVNVQANVGFRSSALWVPVTLRIKVCCISRIYREMQLFLGPLGSLYFWSWRCWGLKLLFRSLTDQSCMRQLKAQAQPVKIPSSLPPGLPLLGGLEAFCAALLCLCGDSVACHLDFSLLFPRVGELPASGQLSVTVEGDAVSFH